MIRFSFERTMGALLLMLTVILSLMMVRSPGTGDVASFLGWTEAVYQNGLVDGYSKVADGYPPLSFTILYVARAFGNAVGLSPLISFKVMILTFQLVSTGIVLLLCGSYWIAAAFNGSILLSGVGLGYMDVCVAPFLITAFWSFRFRHHVLGTALYLIACLIKWQFVLVAPFLAVYLFEISDWRSLRITIGTRLFWHLGVLVAVAIVLLTLFFGLEPARSLGRVIMKPDFFSGNALNLPWDAGFFYRFIYHTPNGWRDGLIPLYGYSRHFIYLLPFRIMFGIVYGLVLVRAIRTEKRFQYCLLFSIVGYVTYAILNLNVHENHLFVAVVLSYILMFHKYTPEHRAITIILAAMFNVNLFVFYGVTGTELQSRVVGIDLSVILAMLYTVTWLLLAVYAWGAAGAARREESEHAEKEHLPAMGST